MPEPPLGSGVPGSRGESAPEPEPRRLRAERLECFGALAGGATHELNNLLATVLMSVDLLRRTCRAPAEKTALTSLEEIARRGLHMARQLQWLACGSECQALRFQPRYLMSDLQRLMISTSSSALVVVADCAPDLWLLEGDPLLVYQLLLAQLLAARDAVAAAGTISLAAHNQWLNGGRDGDANPGPGPYLVFEVTGSRAAPAAALAAGNGRKAAASPFATSPARPLTSPADGEALRALGGFSEMATPRTGYGRRVYLPAVEPGTELQ